MCLQSNENMHKVFAYYKQNMKHQFAKGSSHRERERASKQAGDKIRDFRMIYSNFSVSINVCITAAKLLAIKIG